MKRKRLLLALVALLILGANWSPALLAQQVQVPDPKEIPPGQVAPGDIQIPDEVNTGGWPFTLNIPVTLSKLHEDVVRATILCTIYGDLTGEETAGFEGSVDIPFDETSRSFDGVVNVRLSQREGSTEGPLNATRYHCQLRLYSDQESWNYPQCPTENSPLRENFYMVDADPDDCRLNNLKTATVTGEINPTEGTATACRYGFSARFVDCR